MPSVYLIKLIIKEELIHKNNVVSKINEFSKANIAKSFNDYFISCQVDDDGRDLSNETFSININNHGFDLNFSEFIIDKVIKSMKNSNSLGPDGFSMTFIKLVRLTILYPLSIIFSSSFKTGAIPYAWKLSIISPIYKGTDSRHSITNYRPISITCACCRIMERIIKQQIHNFFVTNNLYCKSQHGFMPNKSTLTANLALNQSWIKAINNGKFMDLVILDIAKAFDTVSIVKLSHKLASYGLPAKLLYWLYAFLNDRHQCTKWQNNLSLWQSIKSGVPQGSVLGPLLFNIYLNDLSKVIIHSKMIIYADDMKIFNADIDGLNANNLADDLNAVVSWMRQWQLTINKNKCNVVHIGKGNPKRNYFIEDQQLNVLSIFNDLGVKIDQGLTFKHHISDITSKAQRLNYLIHNGFYTNSWEFKMRLYKLFILPIVDYNSTIWSPSTVSDINRVENIQRKFTKRLVGLHNFPYNIRLQLLNLITLEERRIRRDLLILYKQLHGITDISCCNSDPEPTQCLIYNNTQQHNCTRGHTRKLFKPSCSSTVYKNSYPFRIINIWNALENDVVEANSVNKFSNFIENISFANNCKGGAS